LTGRPQSFEQHNGESLRVHQIGRPDQRILVAVCTFNELENLPGLIQRIRVALPTSEILVVDDNSPDGTGEWARLASETDPSIDVIIRKADRGLGAAVRAAIQYAIEAEFDWMLNLDADHSHAPEDLPRLLCKAVEDGKQLDCVVGTRYAPGGETVGWPRHRRWMSWLVNRFARSILRIPVSDCSGSLRCYRVAALRRILPETLRSRGYAIFEEVLVRLQRNGATFGEVPIKFHERLSGSSKLTSIEAIKAGLQILKLLVVR
jgi:dolichol-phosphate mannosyltransferase